MRLDTSHKADLEFPYMIGVGIIERLVQAVAISHRVANYPRLSLLILASPESGKTTITASAHAKHVLPIAIITARSVIQVIEERPEIEYLVFNDLVAIRALSQPASMLLIVTLNQATQGECGMVGFAGKDTTQISRQIGIIGCLPLATFANHRARWREAGFISRMIPFAYQYPDSLIAEIKDGIDEAHGKINKQTRKLPRVPKRPVTITCNRTMTRAVRDLSDIRARDLQQTGIRLLSNYHTLIRSHALLCGRANVEREDLDFLRTVDRYVSITECKPLERS